MRNTLFYGDNLNVLPPAGPEFADDLEMIQASQQPAEMPRWGC